MSAGLDGPRISGRILLVGLLALSLGYALEGAGQGCAWAQEAEVAVAGAGAGQSDPAQTPATLADLQKAVAVNKMALDTIWVMVAAFLVFFMNLGFAMIESGLCRAKNCVNILAKNFIVFACASIGFLLLGWGLMFGNGNPFFGTTGLFFAGGSEADYSALSWATVPLWAKFFFQLVFAGTAATIVSGAVAERVKFSSFVVFSFVLCAVIYPLAGHMIWGGGFLAEIGMFDFAGSTVVHSVGGWAALAGVIILGPRLGKYGKDGRVNAIPGHNMTSATVGGLVLWFGWFGFNPGSTMAADFESIAHIAVTTNTAAAASTLTAALTAWLLLGKPDLSMIINGTLAGLVAITAPCAFVSVSSALLIGAVAGVLVVFAVLFFDRVRLDDPVGALSVHLVNGVFGTLAVGLFAQTGICPAAETVKNGLFFGGGVAQLMPQISGIVVAGAVTFSLSFGLWTAIKYCLGVRVSAAEESEGLDLGEHGSRAYPDFEALPGRPEATQSPEPLRIRPQSEPA